MSKRKKNKQRRGAQGQARPRAQGWQSELWRAASLMHRRKWAEARQVLEPLNRRYPRQREILSALAEVYQHLGDHGHFEGACAELHGLNPNDPDLTLMLAGSYLMNIRPTLALRTFQRFVDQWPNHPRTQEVRDTISELEARLDLMLPDLDLAGTDRRELAARHEEVRSLLDRGQFVRARDVAEELLQRKPDFLPVLNNLSLAYFQEGNVDQAVATAQRVLALAPDNFHALGNLIRYQFLAGRHAEAQASAERLKAVESENSDVWVKKAEALSFLGDDQGVLDAVHGAEQAGTPIEETSAALLYHLAGAAACRLGKEDQARRYWQRALQRQPGFDLAKANLQDLRQPQGKRHGPWAYSMPHWLPEKVIKELAVQITSVAGGDEAVEREARKYLQTNQGLVALVPVLLDRGDPAAREFALRLALLAETPELLRAARDFAVSQRGPDDMRLQAAQAASKAGLLPSGNVRMFLQGEWRETLLLGFELHGEPVKPYSPAAEPLAREAMAALHRRDGEQAERLFQKALKLEPESLPLLNNLATAYRCQGRFEEGEALIRDIHARDPDYLFGRVGMSEIYIRQGQLDKAREILEPLLRRRRLHFSEFATLCMGEMNLLLAKGDRPGAESWLGLFEQGYPDHPGLDEWRRRVRRPSLWRRLTQGR